VSPAPDRPSGQASNLRLRIISSVVLIVVVLGITFVGGPAFRLLASAIGAAVMYEWCAMAATAANRRHQTVAAVLLGAVLAALVAGYAALVLLLLLSVSVIVCVLDGRLGGHGSCWAASGLAYAGLSALSLGLLREGGEAGLAAVLFLYAVVWATDISAYFVGRRVGGPKLAPRISPGKTRSGAIGGAIGGVFAGILVAASAGGAKLPLLALVALFLSLIAQAGDLFESWLKRRHGLKDSGRLIPGHGGVMDRVDGLVAAAFALYVIGWVSGSADNPAQGLFAIR
jgi:phosphatidate cytidylyltransferase